MTERFSGDYVEDWPQIALAVKQAAGMRCVRCGHPDGDRLEPESLDDYAYSGRMEGGERRRLSKVLTPCDSDCRHAKDGKLRMLTVHHLDGNKGNNRWWNLLCLCQKCHLSVQSRVIIDRPWLLPHTKWFQPYVAGFYAYYYGRLTVTREEVLADVHRYLALGQPWLYGGAA